MIIAAFFSVQQDKKYRSANQPDSGRLYCETYWSHTETCSDVRGWSLFFRFSVSYISVVAATLESHISGSVLLFYFCDFGGPWPLFHLESVLESSFLTELSFKSWRKNSPE